MHKIFLIVSLVISLGFSFSVFAAKQETATGEFVKVKWGEYQHVVIKDSGKEKTFWCLDSTEGLDCSDIEDDEKNYLGKKISVVYEEQDNFLPETGEKVKQDVVKKITLVQ